MSSDHRSRSSRSSGATPSMSPIRIIGSGAAMSCDEVALAALAHRVDDRVADVADLLLAVAHAARREALVDELAPLPVLGVVHVDHHRDRPVVGPDAARVRERRRVLLGREQRRRTTRCPTRRWARRSRRARSRASTRTSRGDCRRRTLRRADRCRHASGGSPWGSVPNLSGGRPTLGRMSACATSAACGCRRPSG